jgi:hypothetical protein
MASGQNLARFCRFVPLIFSTNESFWPGGLNSPLQAVGRMNDKFNRPRAVLDLAASSANGAPYGCQRTLFRPRPAPPPHPRRKLYRAIAPSGARSVAPTSPSADATPLPHWPPRPLRPHLLRIPNSSVFRSNSISPSGPPSASNVLSSMANPSTSPRTPRNQEAVTVLKTIPAHPACHAPPETVRARSSHPPRQRRRNRSWPSTSPPAPRATANSSSNPPP